MSVLTTFSIVAHDPSSESWGVAVQSKFFAVGTIVPHGQAGAGVIATQASGDPGMGRRGLSLLSEGLTASECIETLLKDDDQRESRQLGIVDHHGCAASYTGPKCFPIAGHLVEESFSVQGNMLAEGTLAAMSSQFKQSIGEEKAFARCLVDALAAGQAAGGEKRGQQSASLLVVRSKGGYGGGNDRAVDLRVDDHVRPIEELERLLLLQEVYLDKTMPPSFVSLEQCLHQYAARLDRFRQSRGLGPDITDQTVFQSFLDNENLGHFFDEDSQRIDARINTILNQCAADD
ncbi:DUF1028 domain-containing protein [Stieleria varia]|uniref:Peptidoglycan binding domain protein n=1 Tax=Stieleria varia TaxID=2528005 RepID=A0A5C6BCM1_9BACT|nr:DUF1028 domain-containing protein [Stieleria varia]TWU08224.1 hypothetical protein Pla52n_08060 [Stieleria varia]